VQQRLDYKQASPEAFQAMLHLEYQIHKSGLEESLLELVKTRASQINGCAWCLDMHTKDARARGETEQRLYLISAWREAACYTDRERAALAWTEAVTQVAGTHDVPDAVYADAERRIPHTGRRLRQPARRRALTAWRQSPPRPGAGRWQAAIARGSARW